MNNNKPKILLVEDNPGDVRLTEEAFAESNLGCVLFVAENGERALDFLYKREGNEGAPTPDLVLLDLNLPKLNGLEFLARVKSDEKLRRLPVLVLSTSTAERDIQAAYDLHANCYLAKPVDLSAFFNLVRTIERYWFGAARLPSES